MSKFRLTRMGLLIASLGLNAALIQGVHAQNAPAAPAAPAGATAAPGLPVPTAPFIKAINPAAVEAGIKKGDLAGAKTKLAEADAFPNKNSAEEYIINQLKLQYGNASKDESMTVAAVEAMIQSPHMKATDKVNYMLALGSTYYNNKNYPKAIDLLNRYMAEPGADANKARPLLVRAYYFTNDYASARKEVETAIKATEAAGGTPSLEDLRLLAQTSLQLKDNPTYFATVEKAVRLHPAEVPENFWSILVSSIPRKQGYNQSNDLDLLRLQYTVSPKALSPEGYVDLAELALAAGFFTEAKKVVDDGFAAGILGKGANASKHSQLRDRATRQAAEDARDIAKGEASAAKAKDGAGLVNLGYAYVTMGQFDKGLELMEKGVARGGMKRPEDAKLHLGIAYAKAGRAADATRVLKDVGGTEAMSTMARYWTMIANRGTAAPSTAAN
jgi:tetratricopeptide (TPR) repeat protein